MNVKCEIDPCEAEEEAEAAEDIEKQTEVQHEDRRPGQAVEVS